MELSEVLREIRKNQKLTQFEVCKRGKFTQTFLSQIESGSKSPSPEMFKRICKVYGIPHQIVFWKTITEKDVSKEKRSAFNSLKPHVDELLKEFFSV